MNILNINSYFLSSSVHENLQNGIEYNGNFKMKTFVPISENYQIRPECTKKYKDNITIDPCFKTLDRISFINKNRKIYRKVNQIYDLNKFDLVYAHSLFTNGLIARKINLDYGIPYIVAIRDTDVNIFFKYMPHLRKVGLDIIRNAKKIIFLSKPYYNEVLSKYIHEKYIEDIKQKSVIIPNPVDNFWFDNIYSSKKKLSSNEVKLLYVGSIEKRKNLERVCKAVRNVTTRGYNLKLNIVGSSKDEKILKKLKSYSFVKYKPRVNKEELINIYRENDIFIMASNRESFGLVYGEAITQGLPVIYTEKQGFDGNFVNGEVGYSVDSKNIKSIEKGIINTILNYEKISENIIEKSYRFKIERITLEYHKILEEIYSNSK